jgi:hypothetical protein
LITSAPRSASCSRAPGPGAELLESDDADVSERPDTGADLCEALDLRLEGGTGSTAGWKTT